MIYKNMMSLAHFKRIGAIEKCLKASQKDEKVLDVVGFLD